MTDGEALLAAVIANPDEDTPRLVYADWLQENGHAERAEFIRVQVAIRNWGVCSGSPHLHTPPARCPECESRIAQRRREQLLMSGQGWWSDYGPGDKVNVLSWQRGFVYSLATTAADWRTHCDPILAQHPVRSVTLTTEPRWGEDGWPAYPDGYGLSATEFKFDEWPGITFTLPARTTITNRVVISDVTEDCRVVFEATLIGTTWFPGTVVDEPTGFVSTGSSLRVGENRSFLFRTGPEVTGFRVRSVGDTTPFRVTLRANVATPPEELPASPIQ